LESMHRIHNILGVPVLIDAAVVGSRAHCPRLWWTNLIPAELLQSAVGRIKQTDMYMSDILDPHRAPRLVYHDDQVPLAVVNRKGEPQKALSTLISFARSYVFKDNGPGLVWDSTTQEMVEPNVDERERAMGFPTGTTNFSGLSEHQRRFLLGQAMDVNCLTWILSLVVVEQKRLASSLVGYMGFYELRAAMEPSPLVMMPSKVVGGEEASIAHPWDMWSFGSFVTKDRARELHGQNSEFAHLRINLEEQVEKMFLEENTAQRMEDVWELGQMEEFYGMMGLEEVEPSSPGIQ
jgi:hypothetical protein